MNKQSKVLCGAMLLVVVIFATINIVKHYNNLKYEKKVLESTIDNNDKKSVEIKKKTPLEDFGQQMEQLCESGMRSGIENYVISKTLTFQDIAQLAERTPLFSYMREYTADSIAIPTTGISILSADIDGNGIQDIIEYGPSKDNASERNANRLIIYLGRADGSYNLSYSQPLFDTYVDWTDIIEVLRYEGQTYLVFVNQREQYLMDAYWISDGTPCGKLEFEYKCKEVKVEIIDNHRELKIYQLIENNMDIYHKVNVQHCTYDYWSNQFQLGNLEIELESEVQAEALYKKYYEKYDAEWNKYLNEYLKKYTDEIDGAVPNCDTTIPLISDINNDGVLETYVKKVGYAWLREKGIPRMGISRNYDILYGDGRWENGGRHEGKRRLFYYMESDGESIDFKSMCGLDLWAGDFIPQWFFIEETEQGNTTFVVYQDKNDFEQRIDGYLINNDGYERVVSLKYIPIIECNSSYQFVESAKNKGVDYVLNLSKDYRSVELMWGQVNEREEEINQSIRAALEEKIAAMEWEENMFNKIVYWPMKATNELCMIGYYISYRIPYGEIWEWDSSEVYSMEINLVSGECREMDSDEQWEMKIQSQW